MRAQSCPLRKSVHGREGVTEIQHELQAPWQKASTSTVVAVLACGACVASENMKSTPICEDMFPSCDMVIKQCTRQLMSCGCALQCCTF